MLVVAAVDLLLTVVDKRARDAILELQRLPVAVHAPNPTAIPTQVLSYKVQGTSWVQCSRGGHWLSVACVVGFSERSSRVRGETCGWDAIATAAMASRLWDTGIYFAQKTLRRQHPPRLQRLVLPAGALLLKRMASVVAKV